MWYIITTCKMYLKTTSSRSVYMDVDNTRRITITDSLFGTTEINFKQVCEPTERKAISSLVLDTVMKYIRENDSTLIDFKNTDEKLVENHVLRRAQPTEECCGMLERFLLNMQSPFYNT